MDEETRQIREDLDLLKGDFDEHQHIGTRTERIDDLDLEHNTGKHLEGIEIKTAKTWINGEPIYRQVVDFGSLPSTNTTFVALGDTIPVANFGELVELRPSWVATTTVFEGNFSNTTNAVYWGLHTGNTNAEVSVTTIGDFTSYTAKVVVEYTRTIT